ncbi:MAG TPA: alpha/beta hydrolase-fold protein [Thermoanaerobaculia bacterium]|nr:alpha/beta hydrolase-fold protein [Thermoanaerobaculia bacterium]
MASSPFRATLQRVFRLENRRRAPRRGTLERLADFPRIVTVYLPPGYGERDYPVLYMQDGQNLFEPERAFVPGQHWRLAEAADAAIHERTASPMIIVGVDHAGPARIDEYTPTRDAQRKGGGKADVYGRMLLDELKPLIDARYRTVASDTAIGGSSLGGLVALHLGLQHADVFRAVAAMSPSVWWDNRVILAEVDTFSGPRPRLWLDVGGREGAEALRDARALRDRLRTHGWSDQNLRYFEDRRGDHSERAWARRARKMLEFLMSPRA